MNVLDLKDRKILYQLDVNARQSNAETARKVGLSKQVVGFRIQRLIDDKVVTKFFAVIDIAKLGFTIHKCYLRLQNVDAKKEAELVAFLVHHPDVVWVGRSDGKYDLIFGTWAKDMTYLDKTLKELNIRFGAFISERHIASSIRGEYFSREYLIANQGLGRSRKSVFEGTPRPVRLDHADWVLLVELGKNARTSAVELARAAGISADTVAARIRKLEAEVIRRYNIVPNESKYPYVHYKMLIGLRNITQAREQALLQYCSFHPNVVFCLKTLGPWEFELDLEVESAEQFREIMMDFKTQFQDILKDYSALQIYQVHKYTFCPSIPRE